MIVVPAARGENYFSVHKKGDTELKSRQVVIVWYALTERGMIEKKGTECSTMFGVRKKRTFGTQRLHRVKAYPEPGNRSTMYPAGAR